mgnify:CR=1 FL=1
MIQDFPENKNKQQLLKFSHDFYNNRGELANKYHKISSLLPSKLTTIFDSYFEYQKEAYTTLKDGISKHLKNILKDIYKFAITE